MIRSTVFVAGLAFGLATSVAAAAEIKIGFISTFSGPSAASGDYANRGVELFLETNPEAFEPHQIEIIRRDDTGPNAEVARRMAQELIVREGVDIIMGLQYTPNAFAALDITNQAQVPVVIHNAATSSITEASPHVVRVSRTLWGSAYPLGQYVAEELGAKTATILFSDYGPGKDARDGFERAFTDAGGEVVDIIPLPFPQTPDFTPFLQRVREAAPDVVFAFVPAGRYATAFVTTYDNIGLTDVSQLVGPFDIAPPSELELMGDSVEGTIIVGHYADGLDNPENQAFLAAWNEAYPDVVPDPFAVQAYDAMAAIAAAVQATDGDFDGESFVDALRGWTYASPRGPLTIDAETRDAVQNQYVMEIQRDSDGDLQYVVLETIPDVGDPWKDLGIGKQ